MYVILAQMVLIIRAKMVMSYTQIFLCLFELLLFLSGDISVICVPFVRELSGDVSAVLCDLCNKWSHRQCVNMEKSE